MADGRGVDPPPKVGITSSDLPDMSRNSSGAGLERAGTAEERSDEVEFPLLKWTRRLSAAERRADRESDAPDAETLVRCALAGGPVPRRDPDCREHMLPPHNGRLAWHQILPLSVPQCRICTLPSSTGTCAGCMRLVAALGQPADTLEMLAMARTREEPESTFWAWKERAAANGTEHGPSDWLSGTDAALSSYVDRHADRLLEGDPVVTFVPTRAALVAAAFRRAGERHWSPGIEPRSTGKKVGKWFQHESNQVERLSRTADHWSVEADVVERPVLLFDDVFVSGASMFSYAHALKRAGATEVRAVAVVRHIDARNPDYHDAARITRRTQPLSWSARQPHIAYAKPA